MIDQWQNTQNGFDDCLENLDEDNSELSDLEIQAKFYFLKSIMDKHDHIRHQFDFISEEYEKRYRSVSARRIK